VTPAPVTHALYRYAERRPSPQNATLVLNYWSFQSDAPMPSEPYIVFPDGCASIACVRTGGGGGFMALIGPRVTQLQPTFGKGTRIWGIRLWPDAIQPALGIGAREVRDYFGYIPPNVRPAVTTLAHSLPRSDDGDTVLVALDGWVRDNLRPTAEPDPRVRRAIRAIARRRGEGSMAEVAREAAVGLRHLQRLFPLATGLTMREYARVRRVREAIAMRLDRNASRWSEIAASTGFVDHAHLTREFIALTGAPPRVAARQLGTTAHHDVRP
jgi:AraC-like DNA-binding protein